MFMSDVRISGSTYFFQNSSLGFGVDLNGDETELERELPSKGQDIKIILDIDGDREEAGTGGDSSSERKNK